MCRWGLTGPTCSWTPNPPALAQSRGAFFFLPSALISFWVLHFPLDFRVSLHPHKEWGRLSSGVRQGPWSTARLQSCPVVTRSSTGRSGRHELPRSSWEGRLVHPGCGRPCGLCGPHGRVLFFSAPSVDASLLCAQLSPLPESTASGCSSASLPVCLTPGARGLQSRHSTEKPNSPLIWLRLASSLGGGSGSPLQCSCLENPRDGGAWWAGIYGGGHD